MKEGRGRKEEEDGWMDGWNSFNAGRTLMTERGNEGRSTMRGRPRCHEVAHRNGWCRGTGEFVTHPIVAHIDTKGDARTRRTDG